MNKFLTLIITFFLVLGLTVGYAQETVTEETKDDNITTPDSAFYGLSNAAEKINLAFTLNKAKKAEKQLKFAEKRILAAKKLIRENKLDYLERLKSEHKKLVEEASSNLELVSENQVETALGKQVEIEKVLEEQENKLEEVSTDLDLKDINKLNDEQLIKLKEFLATIDNNIGNFKIKIKAKEERLKIRLKEQGKNPEEIEVKIKEIKEKRNLTDVKKRVAENHIANLERKLDKLKEITQKHKERGKDVTEMENRLKEVEGIITEIKTKLISNEIESVKELVKKANQLLNFREVFRALEKNDSEKLKELNKERLIKRDEIKKDLVALKEIRKDIKEIRKEKTEKREEKQEQLKSKSEEKRSESSDKTEETTTKETTENTK